MGFFSISIKAFGRDGGISQFPLFMSVKHQTKVLFYSGCDNVLTLTLFPFPKHSTWNVTMNNMPLIIHLFLVVVSLLGFCYVVYWIFKNLFKYVTSKY